LLIDDGLHDQIQRLYGASIHFFNFLILKQAISILKYCKCKNVHNLLQNENNIKNIHGALNNILSFTFDDRSVNYNIKNNRITYSDSNIQILKNRLINCSWLDI